VAQRHIYRHDPIVEALCEFRFVASDDEWDVTLPGRFYEKVKAEYHGKPRQHSVGEAEFQAITQPEGSALPFKGSFTKVLFPTQDDQRLVAVGKNVLSIHVLDPYPNWEDFYPRIQRAFQSYREVSKPTGVRTITIRYINRVLIKATSFDLNEYFTIAPKPPPSTPLTTFGFLSRIESMYQDQPIRLATTLASTDAPEGTSAFLLDLEVARSWLEEPLPLEEAMASVHELRERERDAFEACITDRTREVFDAE
jgi:uncharacterized protein (TIGR04255 family)